MDNLSYHPQSLPSNFYFPTPEDISNHPFFSNDYNDDDDDDNSSTPVPTVDNSAARTRLEVLKGWEISFAILSLYAASFLALIYVLLISMYTASIWNQTGQMPSLSTFEIIFKLILEYASFALPIIFVLHISFSRRATYEQIWTFILLAVGLFATNPLTNTSPEYSVYSPIPPQQIFSEFPFKSLVDDPHKRIILNDAIYTAFIYLYLILAANSYRVFDVKQIHSFRFYGPKLTVACIYVLVKVVTGFQFNVSLGLIPYSRVLTWLILERSGRGSLRITIPVLMTTIMDTAFGFWLIHEVARTAEFLATVPYLENRAKQLGFRCFVYQTIAFCFNIIGLAFIINWRLPTSYINAMFDESTDRILQLEPPVGRLGLAFVYFMWTLVLAYVNLPPQPLWPLIQQIIAPCLFFFKTSRVAVWMGLADIVTTEEMEDYSDDGTEMVPVESGNAHVTVHREPKKVPLRYCHRELLEQIGNCTEAINPNEQGRYLNDNSMKRNKYFVQETHHSMRTDFGSQNQTPNPLLNHGAVSPSSSTTGPGPTPSVVMETEKMNSSYDHASPLNINRMTPKTSHGQLQPPKYPTPAYMNNCSNHPQHVRNTSRVRIRKNLFVMETQVMMSNAAYLSYIPGNHKEELPKHNLHTKKHNMPLLHTGSLSTDLNDLARQIEEEEIDLESGQRSPASSKEDTSQPDFDNGSMFQVDPYEMAEKYGYKLHRHICNEELNTHAIILTNSSRVIVAFSGTRNVQNWSTNANLKRTLLDDWLSRFEYELEDSADNRTEKRTQRSDIRQFNYRKLKSRHSKAEAKWSHPGKIRRCKSDDSISIDFSSNLLPEHEKSSSSYSRMRRSYGAIESTDEQPPEWLSLEGHLRHAHLRAHQSVTAVASTFARELLTFGQAKVHEGFLNAYMSLRKQVMGTLIELYKGVWNNNYDSSNGSVGIAHSLPVFFCGHSLGGALATFASYEAARYYKRIGISRRQDISCTTFGCPQIGNEAFKYRYERLVETHWRFEIASDPIPTIPHVLLNYVPVGVQVLIDQSGMLLIDPSFVEVQWWGRLANLYLGYRLHIRASYCMALKTYCKLYNNGSDDLRDKFWPFPIRVQTRGLFGQART